MDSRSILRSLSHFRHLRISFNDSSHSRRYICMLGSNNGTEKITKRYLWTSPLSLESISDPPFEIYDHARTIFVRGLSKSTLEDSLSAYFSKYGTVIGCRLEKDKESGELQGFGYVGFRSSEEAERASKFLWHRIDGESVIAKISDPKYSFTFQAQSSLNASKIFPQIEVELSAISTSRFKVTCQEPSSTSSELFATSKFRFTVTCKKTSREGLNAFAQCPFYSALMDELKTIPSHVYDESTGSISFEFRDYNLVVAKLREFKLAKILLRDLPEIVKRVSHFLSLVVSLHTKLWAFSDEISGNPKSVIDDNLENIDDTLVQDLYPFQKDGVKYGIRKNGRVLLADEMGLGKTIQALGIAHHYRQEWPLLIVCPASVKRVWKNQIEKFLPSVNPSDIFMIEKSTDLIPKGQNTSAIVIMSYESMTSRLDELEAAAYNVIIFDESHFLKETRTKRTQAATDLSKIANRKILLTGTPALSRPNELFPQIHIIDPEQFPCFTNEDGAFSYGHLQYRYKIFKGADHSKVSNSEEFAALLQQTVLVHGIRKNGRVLLADEMGLGKTIQALGIAHHYRQEWPLLIVCPASVKRVWKNQIEKFLPSVNPSDIHLIEKSTDLIPKGQNISAIVIMSYESMTSRLDELEAAAYNVIIFDESHFLKETKSRRTQAATDLSKIANRKILLTGTPALSRPNELFPQIHIIDPEQFPCFKQLGGRYKIIKGAVHSKVSNSEELAALLQQTVLIRRLKKDVRDNLPEKRREIIWLEIGESEHQNADALNETREAYWRSQTKQDEKYNLLRYFAETAKFKSLIVGKEIAETYFYEGAPTKKMIIFAHHQKMMASLSEMLERKGVKFIRIDGPTAPQAHRPEMCEQFQNDPDTTVALISVRAAGYGITLTAASHVIFAELYWTPGNLKQAEDRAHRIGQKNPVIVQYMLAKKTADEDMWGMILDKLEVLDSVNLSPDNYESADLIHRDIFFFKQFAEGMNIKPKIKKDKKKKDPEEDD